MYIYVTKPEKIASETTPDIVADCRLRSHREILRIIAEGIGLEVTPRASIYDIAQSIALSPPPYRRILVTHLETAPARLALSLDIIARAGRHTLWLQAARTNAAAVEGLRLAGYRVIRDGVMDWSDVRGAVVYLLLLGGIALTVALPSWARQWGVDGGIMLIVVVYIVRRYLWRAVWRHSR